MALVAGLLGALVVALAVGGLVLVQPVEPAFLRSDLDLPDRRKRRSIVATIFDATSARLGPPLARILGPERLTEIGRRLAAAGRPGGMTADAFVGRKASFVAASGVVGLILALGGHLFLLLVLGLFGWFWMDLWLTNAVRRRQSMIERELPDFLDVVAVTVGAGLGFRVALGRVAEAMPGPLAEEITGTLRAIDIGATRREALTDLRDNNGSESLSKFVGALLQSEQLGTPLSQTLIVLAGDIRRSAGQAARRRAAQAAPRISLILTTIVVPGAVILMVTGLVLGSGISLGDVLSGR